MSRRLAAPRLVAPLLLLGALTGSPEVFAQAGSPLSPQQITLRFEGVSALAKRPDGRSRVRVFFKAYAPDQAVYGGFVDKETARQQLRIDGAMVPDSLLSLPRRGGAGADTVPLALWLGIDVSRSMGRFFNPNASAAQGRDNLALRGYAMTSALRAFLMSIRGQGFAQFKLVPFGTRVPQDVAVDVGNQRIGDWKDRYLSVKGAEYLALAQGLSDIYTFISVNSTPMGTKLWSAIGRSLDELGAAGKYGAASGVAGMKEGAKTVVVMLTDATGLDPGDPVSRADIKNRLANDQTLPAIYLIGFGDCDESTLANVRDILAVANRGRLQTIRADESGAAELQRVYEEIFRVEGSSWYVDAVGCDDPTGCRIRFVKETIPPPPIDTLLLPTPLMTQTVRARLVTFGVSLLVILALYILWYKTRPRGSRDLSLPDEMIDSKTDSTEAVSLERQPLTGMSIQEYRRMRNQALKRSK